MEEGPPGAQGNTEPVTLRDALKAEVQARNLLGSERINPNDNLYSYPPFTVAFTSVLGKEFPGTGRTVAEELQARLDSNLSQQIRDASTTGAPTEEVQPIDLVRYITSTVIKDMPAEMDDRNKTDQTITENKLATFKARLQNTFKTRAAFKAFGYGPDSLGVFIAQQIITETNSVAPYFVSYLKYAMADSYHPSGYQRENQKVKFAPRHYFAWTADVVKGQINIANLDARQATEGMGYK